MKLRFRRLRRDDGQALVEMAFVLPLLLLFLFGIIDFGMALNQYNTNTNLANIAVRQVAIIGNNTSVTCDGTKYTDIQSWLKCEAKVTGESIPNSVCVADTATGTPTNVYVSGDPVQVKVSSTFNWMSILSSGSGFIGSVVNPSSNITASATMRLEQAPSDTSVSGIAASGSGYTNTFLSPQCK